MKDPRVGKKLHEARPKCPNCFQRFMIAGKFNNKPCWICELCSAMFEKVDG